MDTTRFSVCPKRARGPLLASLAALALAGRAYAQWVVPLEDLRFTVEQPNLDKAFWLSAEFGPAVLPRVTFYGEGSTGVVGTPPIRGRFFPGQLAEARLAYDAQPQDEELEGVLYLPDEEGRALEAYPFAIPDLGNTPDRETYDSVLADHYGLLAGAAIPGRPYFRRLHGAYGGDGATESELWQGRERSRADAFAMFTGGRALAENLRLDEIIDEVATDENLVPLDTIEGIEVPEMDWNALTRGPGAQLDSLSRAVPVDQYAVFFPSFDAMVRVADRLAGDAMPLVQLFDQRSVQQLVRERYERQLALGLDALTRRFGGKLVDSVAMTGSDPYLRTGSDVAILFDGDVNAIQAFLRARVTAAAKEAGVATEESAVLGWETLSAQTVDRRLSTHVAATDDFVVVTNSVEQLRRVLGASDGTVDRLEDSKEYVWFRDRYRLTDEATDAFLVVTDAAIRRWSGPKWRIATARRTRALAALADADAWAVAKGFGERAGEDPSGALPVRGGGEIRMVDGAALDSVYGTSAFSTPIAELAIDEVAVSEREGYEQWRRRFEASWGGAFDPLAVRFDVREDGLDVDLTLIPLILRTEYRYLIELAGDELLDETVPGAHPEALVYWVSAIDHDEPSFRGIKGFLSSLSLGGELDWVGDHIALWVDDDDEYFARLQDTDSADMFVEEMLPGLPVGVRIDTKSPLAAAAFLTSVRGLMRESLPGMFEFETRSFEGREYVAVVSQEGLGFGDTPTVFYAATPRGLVVSFSAEVVERALARSADERVPQDWEQRGVSLTVRGETRELVAVEGLELAAEEQMRAKSWRNLPILNEWKRRNVEDPVQFHEDAFGARLVCPGGGKYVWNEEHGTMESTVYGHPADPREGPVLPPALGDLELLDFGLAFETFDVVQPADDDTREGPRFRNRLRGLRAQIRLR